MFDGADITGLKPYERARRGIGFVPQGREIFPLLTVEENLKTGFGPLKRENRNIPDDVFSLFPVLNSMLRRRGGELHAIDDRALPPVELPDLLAIDAPFDQSIADAERREEQVRRLRERAHRVAIEVIVVIVRQEHATQRRQVLERDRRRS